MEKSAGLWNPKKNMTPARFASWQASFRLIKLPLHPAQLFIGLTVDDHLAVAAPWSFAPGLEFQPPKQGEQKHAKNQGELNDL